MLLILATVAVAPLWLLDAPNMVRIVYTVLALSLPAALMVSNPELMAREEPAARPKA